MAEQLVFRSIPALRDMRRMAHSAIQSARQVTTASVQFAGSDALMATLTTASPAEEIPQCTGKGAVVPSSVAAVAKQDTVMKDVLAERMFTSTVKTPTAVELVSH